MAAILALSFSMALTASTRSAGSPYIEPLYVYNGINRPFLVKIVARGGNGLEVKLLGPSATEIVESAPVRPGDADLAQVLPDIWKKKDPRVLHAQLFFRGKAIGPALVLQPMTVPAISRLKPDGKTVEFVPDEDQEYAGIRAWIDKDLVFKTSLGDMRFRLRPDCAPNTVYNVMSFVTGGLYRDTIFHRVVAMSHGFPFVIQGGDPAGTGSGAPGFSYTLEDSSLPHDFGVISIARSTDPNTNGCQIFVCLSREGTSRLDHKYPSFGQCIEGADTILKIAAVPVGKEDRPFRPPVIYNAELQDAAPYGTGPAALIKPS